MGDTTLISVRVSAKTAERLNELAKATDRSKSYLAAQAIEEYLATQEWQLRVIEQGIIAADSEELLEHKDVKQWVESWGSNEERELP